MLSKEQGSLPMLKVNLTAPTFFFLFLFFIFGCAGSPQLSLVAVSVGYSSLWYMGFSLRWLLLLRSIGSRAHGLQQLRLLDSRAQAQQLWHMGLLAQQYVQCSWTRDQTRVLCIGRDSYPLHHHRSSVLISREHMSACSFAVDFQLITSELQCLEQCL